MGVCEALCDMLACKKGNTNTFDLIYLLPQLTYENIDAPPPHTHTHIR